MSTSITPDLSALEIPMDAWSQPFWDAAAARRLVMPRCAACGTFRWPAGPFCPQCHTQALDWVAPGQGRIYSFTILPVRGETEGAAPQCRVPALVEFADAPGVRLVSSLIGAPAEKISIGAAVEIDWLAAANATVPVFRLAGQEV
jgi:uncharacterized OB-fold protein